MAKRLECEVFGRVQLVMYRDFASRCAKSFGIVGTVENMKNGNVFVIAEGEEERLNEFLVELSRGSFFSKVTNIKSNWFNATGEFKDFSIIFYDRR